MVAVAKYGAAVTTGNCSPQHMSVPRFADVATRFKTRVRKTQYGGVFGSIRDSPCRTCESRESILKGSGSAIHIVQHQPHRRQASSRHYVSREDLGQANTWKDDTKEVFRTRTCGTNLNYGRPTPCMGYSGAGVHWGSLYTLAIPGKRVCRSRGVPSARRTCEYKFCLPSALPAETSTMRTSLYPRSPCRCLHLRPAGYPST